jgi:hypothetical protein
VFLFEVINGETTVVNVDVRDDTDGDGIADGVDTLPATFSNVFDDGRLGGTSDGTILDRGDQILTITDRPTPAGVRIGVDPTGGPSPATVTACGGLSSFALTEGDDMALTCGSITIQVFGGTVEIEFVGDDGQLVTTSLEDGNTLTFESSTSSFVAPPTNAGAVIVLVDGDEYPLFPGAALVLVTLDVKPRSDPNTWPCKNIDNGLPVGVMSHVGFDATTLDADSVRFGKTGVESAEVHTDTSGNAQRHVKDINRDGLLDMVFHFRFGDTGFSCSDIPSGEKSVTLPAYLTGSTVDGTTIQGEDTLRLR